MTVSHKNPFRFDLDTNYLAVSRDKVCRKLDGALMNVEVPQCVAVVAEREMGGPVVIRNYLKSRRDQLPFRVVHCDVKVHLGKGDSAAHFYRALISFIKQSLPDLPDAAHRAADRMRRNTSNDLMELNGDIWTFFGSIHDSQRPLLIVFYSFDRLPDSFTFDAFDWTALRQFNDNPGFSVYYLVVSRRPLSYIEDLWKLGSSGFASIFDPIITMGLLEESEAWSLIRGPGQRPPVQVTWPEWLAQTVFHLGGRHPYCIQRICFELFERMFNQHELIEEDDAEQIAKSLQSALTPYFERLVKGLERDRLLEPMIYALKSGHSASMHLQLSLLQNLGYLSPEHASVKQYRLFSPLFRDYLVQRGILEPTVEHDSDQLARISSGKESLTNRELEVLQLVAHQRSNPEIARDLSITEDTVKTHIRNIYKKLGVDGDYARWNAVDRARQLKLL